MSADGGSTSDVSEVPQLPGPEPLTYNWAGTTGIGVNPPDNRVLPGVSESCEFYRAVELTPPREVQAPNRLHPR